MIQHIHDITNFIRKRSEDRTLICVFFVILMSCFSANARMVRGEVVDSITLETIAYANVYFVNSSGGVLTDLRGQFTFRSTAPADTIIVSVMGYTPKTLLTSDNNIKILLSPTSTQLSEVVVHKSHQKYSKKNNPAVMLMERVRRDAPLHDPRKCSFYRYDKQGKISLGLNDYHFENESDKSKHKFGFLQEYVDTSYITGLPYLSLITKESLSSELYSDSRGHKQLIRARRSNGIDEAFHNDNISNMLTDIFREVDIYANDIPLMQNRFVSPLSNIGANYYKYFITDTLMIDNQQCIELTFAPHNPESMGFNGRMYIPVNDSVAYVKKLTMRVPSAINLNYINNLYIVQDFEPDTDNNIHKVKDVMGVELQLIPGTQTFYAERNTDYGNFSTHETPDWTEWFAVPGEDTVLPHADLADDTIWSNYALVPLSTELERPSLMSRLRKVPAFYWAEKVLTILVEGYVRTGRNSKFDFGPVNTLISVNTIEGARFRIGGMTTANLSKRIFARGYVAYGCKDKKFKYRGELDFSLIDKKYHSREFPVNGFRLSHEYDYDMIGQHYLFTNADNIFLSWKRAPSDKVTMRRLSKLSYIYENARGWSFEVSAQHQRQHSTPWLPFETASSEASSPKFLPHYNLTSIFFKVRFAPGEKFYQSNSDRLPINMDAPIVILTHEYGPKKLFGSDFEFNRTELSVQKRFWFSAFGYTDIILKGGILWSSVYYPALIWPNANLSYTIQPESYSLMMPMEFATDHYFSWDLTYWGNGVLFNRVPLIKKAKLREVITFKGLMGGLNKRNNPIYQKNILRFPSEAGISTLTRTPYMELSAGIDNILTILRVDYVWRLTYRNSPGIDHSGVRISLHFTF